MKNKYIYFIFIIILTFNISAQEKEKDSLFDKDSKTFMVLPLITNNPAMKTGFGVMPMFFFKLKKEDPLSPPSIIGFYGLYTTNGSYIAVPNAWLFWNEDKNRATIVGGTMRTNNDFTYQNAEGEDFQLVFSELRTFVTLDYSRKMIGDFYLGLMYLGTQTSYKFDKGTDEENEFTKEFFKENGITDNFVSSVGLNFSFDSRDYVYNPTKGLMFSIRPKLNREWLGSDNDYVDTDFEGAFFIPLSSKGVLAFGNCRWICYRGCTFRRVSKLWL